MKGKRFTEEPITYALRRAEDGTPVADVCRQLRDEHARFKRLVAALTLDKHILGEVVRKRL
jgi:putative transposase